MPLLKIETNAPPLGTTGEIASYGISLQNYSEATLDVRVTLGDSQDYMVAGYRAT